MYLFVTVHEWLSKHFMEIATGTGKRKNFRGSHGTRL